MKIASVCLCTPEGPAAESRARKRSASWTTESEGVVARETEALGRISFWSRLPPGELVTHVYGNSLGANSLRFVVQGGACLGQLALLRQNSGSLVSLPNRSVTQSLANRSAPPRQLWSCQKCLVHSTEDGLSLSRERTEIWTGPGLLCSCVATVPSMSFAACKKSQLLCRGEGPVLERPSTTAAAALAAPFKTLGGVGPLHRLG